MEPTAPGNQPEIEHYRFTANGNLQAYMYENLLYVHYGYNDANTRTYKYSFDLTPNWVNGRLESVNFTPRTAMFYPNSYLNFNSNGYYTKHYYNGMERIASRLGDQNISINVNDPELQDRKDWQDSLIRKNIVEITGYEFLEPGEEQTLEDPKPVFELPVIGISNLQPSADGIYYYHPNHLGSTCYVTDENAIVQQGFLYAPFGEITNGHNSSFGNGVIPKYSFNAKELDEETGFYYYEARYYAPPIFISRDVLFEEKPWFTPYHYCSNNPVVRVDPSGMMDDWYKNKNTQYYTWFDGSMPHEGYEHIGEKGCLLGDYEPLIDNILKEYGHSGLYKNGLTLDFAPEDKGALIGSQNRGWSFLDEFVSGTGPEISILFENHPYTQSVKNFKTVQKAQKILSDGNTDVYGQITNVKYDFGVLDVLLSGFSIEKQFIGSYRFDCFTSSDQKYLYNIVSDCKSATSLFYHSIPNQWNKQRTGETHGFTNTYQFYIWNTQK